MKTGLPAMPGGRDGVGAAPAEIGKVSVYRELSHGDNGKGGSGR